MTSIHKGRWWYGTSLLALVLSIFLKSIPKKIIFPKSIALSIFLYSHRYLEEVLKRSRQK